MVKMHSADKKRKVKSRPGSAGSVQNKSRPSSAGESCDHQLLCSKCRYD